MAEAQYTILSLPSLLPSFLTYLLTNTVEISTQGTNTRLIRSGKVRSDQIRSGQVRLGQVRLVQVRLGQVRSGNFRSGLVRSGLVRTLFKSLLWALIKG